MNNPTDKLVEVTQADRDAAADLYAILHDVWPGYSAAHCIREGDDDKREVVQAFARHRLSIERETLERAAKVADADTGRTPSGGAGLGPSVARRIARAIRGLQQ